MVICSKFTVNIVQSSAIIISLQVHPETLEYVRNSKGFCIPAGVDEPGELISWIPDDTQVSGYTDSKAANRKVDQ